MILQRHITDWLLLHANAVLSLTAVPVTKSKIKTNNTNFAGVPSNVSTVS